MEFPAFAEDDEGVIGVVGYGRCGGLWWLWCEGRPRRKSQPHLYLSSSQQTFAASAAPTGMHAAPSGGGGRKGTPLLIRFLWRAKRLMVLTCPRCSGFTLGGRLGLGRFLPSLASCRLFLFGIPTGLPGTIWSFFGLCSCRAIH